MRARPNASFSSRSDVFHRSEIKSEMNIPGKLRKLKIREALKDGKF
jgi:hypothetical protein